MQRFIAESNVTGNPLEKEYLRNPDLNNLRNEEVLMAALKMVQKVTLHFVDIIGNNPRNGMMNTIIATYQIN